MDRQEIHEIISRVVAACALPREVPLAFPVEVSARHVHLTAEAVHTLFGPDAALTPKRPLSQPGQFLSEERVRIVTAKGELANVAVLGPIRPAVQVELSATDARTLGIRAPLRLSGDLRDAADVYLIGPKGMLAARGSAIVAQAHVHLTPPQATEADVTDGQQVSVRIGGERPVTLERVVVRVSDAAGLAMHIDSDEANACMLPQNATAHMLLRPEAGTVPSVMPQTVCVQPAPDPAVCARDTTLITESGARKLAAQGKIVRLGEKTIVTPAAQDVFRHAGVTLTRG